MTHPILPLRVHGIEASYFTGKLEAYLRYKEIPYERIAASPGSPQIRATGVGQIPAVELADGRFMTDTTPMIAWLEGQFPETTTLPADPVQAFLSLLIEDYGDEWLWRPAMHYRWSYPTTALHMSRTIVEQLDNPPVPKLLLRFVTRLRQRTFFVRRDGVNRETWAHVEATYIQLLAQLETMFENRPFLLGDLPTIGDFGLFGSLFRHFGSDPTPATIMRDTAPGVYAWVARMWAARASRVNGSLVDGIPDDWSPLLESIGATHLQHLSANAAAWNAGSRHFDVEVEGVTYRKLRTAIYRVWCLEELRRHYKELSEAAQATARDVLEKHGCWEPLWRVDTASGVDPGGDAPFAPGHSMTGTRLVR